MLRSTQLLFTVLTVYFHARAFSSATAQTVDDAIATCGGLPTRLSDSVQVDLAPQVRTGLPSECVNWSGIRGCCTTAEAEFQNNATKLLVSTLDASWGSDNRQRHCFAGYHDKRCDLAVQWVRCAQVCDTLFPRDSTTGQPKLGDAGCYELFAPPRGIDRVLLGGPGTACERAKEITDLGECSYIAIAGEIPITNTKDFVIEESNIAIAVGGGKAICIQGSASQVELSTGVLLFVTVLFLSSSQ